jgi:hypothetical protein
MFLRYSVAIFVTYLKSWILNLFWISLVRPFYIHLWDFMVRGSNPGGGEIFRSCPDRPWGPPSLLYSGYRVCFPGVKRPGRGVNHPPSSSAEVKERVELYLCSPTGSSWPAIGWILPFTFTYMHTWNSYAARNLKWKSCFSLFRKSPFPPLTSVVVPFD